MDGRQGPPEILSTELNPAAIPLGLYLHLPWCLHKCPYCDFNSHPLKGAQRSAQKERYLLALKESLAEVTHSQTSRRVQSIYFGGGTPSLFSPDQINQILSTIHHCFTLDQNAEITMEANPGAAESGQLEGYLAAGINRLSLGVQSFSDPMLGRLGRIHGRKEALAVSETALRTGFDSVNLDLMFALPEQTLDQARSDLETLLSLDPDHISLYQLTLEANTLFHANPPKLPEQDSLWAMQEVLFVLLEEAGYQQYEVSAWSKPGKQCRHNLNYWEFGDYLGVGAGAHGKLTATDGIRRTTQPRHPNEFMRGLPHPETSNVAIVSNEEAGFEFFLNGLRLREGVATHLLPERTGLELDHFSPLFEQLEQLGLLLVENNRVMTTPRGYRFLNETLEFFLPT